MLVWDGLDVLLVGKVEALAWEAMEPRTLVGIDVGCEVATIGIDATVNMGDDVVMVCWGVVWTNDCAIVGWTFCGMGAPSWLWYIWI